MARDGLLPFLVVFVAAEGGVFVLEGAHRFFMESCAVWVAAVVSYGHAFRVCSLCGECPCRRGRSSPGCMSQVAWGYHVKPGEEPCLLAGGGGGGRGVIVRGDEVQQGPWSVEGRGAAVPARAWYALVIVSDWWHIGIRGVVFGDGSADGVRSSCFVLLLLGVWCSLGRDRRCWC